MRNTKDARNGGKSPRIWHCFHEDHASKLRLTGYDMRELLETSSVSLLLSAQDMVQRGLLFIVTIEHSGHAQIRGFLSITAIESSRENIS